MFFLPDSWVWDFWFADDGDRYHLFFLYASRALKDPEARHYRASIGHAVSDDLTDWTRIEDALVRSDAPAFDDLATWTGSTIRGADGRWRLFYTGSTRAPDGTKNIQSIGVATSPDLLSWTKSPANPVLTADGRWYETLSEQWHDEAFRDPWVFADPSGHGWHMLITARARTGADPFTRGVVGHATSPDLDRWRLQEPLTAPAPRGFGQLEVMQTEIVDGHAVLVFSCLAEHASLARRDRTGGIWAAPAESLVGPFDIDAAYPLTDDRLYSGRLIRQRDGRWAMLAFELAGDDTPFIGSITDPMPVGWVDGRLIVADLPARLSSRAASTPLAAQGSAVTPARPRRRSSRI
ncbi:glycoside hydrolase family 68 protein [Leifsonia shinshuensis]|uniref:glycoside hydrolase family 68 protein n=1 Tax=Leifsonia shinshuensis TaxID=150026 RepID=UPI001F506B67|nr:glycoside hydrolase family 68 protein [Leifsonia shinshuensis]MCI0157784.1 glycoside hydrolase family 68 protein [Leifsonia shinshuensis]